MLTAVPACTPSSHTLEPYRDDPVRAAGLEVRAAQQCNHLPPNDFTTDGCSSWPDNGWVTCCVEHDMAYWCGGSSAERQNADAEFRACIARDHGTGWATAMYWGVRAGGSAWWPLPWRWGYGWPWPEGYSDDVGDSP